MSDHVEYTPDQIEEIGRGPMNDLANYYDDINTKTRFAGAERDAVFQDEAIGGNWNELFNLFQGAVSESAVNIRALAQALVETAEEQRDTEWANEQELQALATELEDQYGDEVTDIVENGTEPTSSENYEEPPLSENNGESSVTSQSAEENYDEALVLQRPFGSWPVVMEGFRSEFEAVAVQRKAAAPRWSGCDTKQTKNGCGFQRSGRGVRRTRQGAAGPAGRVFRSERVAPQGRSVPASVDV